jgi:hypothetical protein
VSPFDNNVNKIFKVLQQKDKLKEDKRIKQIKKMLKLQ